MTLELNKIASDVDAMGQTLAERAARLGHSAEEARKILGRIGVADDELRAKIDKAGDRWPGAVPTLEPVDAAFDLPSHPDRAVVFGADGSQVYPNRHGTALYYVINVGSIAFEHGADGAPSVLSQPRVFYEEDDLYLDSFGLIPTPLIDGQRDVAELTELARLSKGSASDHRLALVDNGLMLWLALQVRDMNERVERIVDQQIEQLTAIQMSGACLAGFVGRPRNANVVQLLDLASRPLERITPEELRASRFRGLTDHALFEGHLQPGQRSALFVNHSPVQIVERYKKAHHEMHFFYLNCGRDGQSEIARVEVPQWVARNPGRLEFVHAAIVEQCRVPDGFPYVLVRAHELAVVTMEERGALEDMVSVSLMRRGLRARISQKAQTKQWTGSRRQHRL